MRLKCINDYQTIDIRIFKKNTQPSKEIHLSIQNIKNK